MILIITNRTDYTTDYLVLRLNQLNIPYIRFNTEDFPFDAFGSLMSEDEWIDLKKPGKRIQLNEIRSVWYRRPESPDFPSDFESEAKDFVVGECREFLQGIWRSLECLWINPPDRIRLSENKVEQLKRMKKLGLRIPKTVITNDPDSVRTFFQSNMGNIVAKTLRQSHGTFDGQEYVIYTNRILENDLQLLESVKSAPVIFQERIEKTSDIRVTVVGSEVFATEIHSQANSSTSVDWRRNTLSLRHTFHRLPAEVEEKCLRLVESYGLVFGALDLIKTPSSEYVFLELNPNGQWAWIEVLTHQPITEKLIQLLTEPESQT